MTRPYSTVLALFVIGTLHAQVPNGGFENWNGNVPANWSANNIAPLNFYVITSSADAHTGSLAARGEVLQNPIIASQVVSPTMQTSGGAPVTQDPPSVLGWYKFGPMQATTKLVIGVTVVDINGAVTGIGTAQYPDAQNSYTQFTVPINYDIGPSAPAASVTVSFIIADDVPNGAIGSWYLIDDVSMEGATGLQDLEILSTNVGVPFPTPFSTSTTLPITLSATARVQVDVVDLLGRSIERIMNGNLSAGEHRLGWNPGNEIKNGVYFLRVTDPSGVSAKRVLLQR